MTAISATQYNAYFALRATTLRGTVAASAGTAGGDGSSQDAATRLTLSPGARAAMAAKSFSDVVSDGRAALDKLYAAAKIATPYKNDKLMIDLAGLDRRTLYAVASNGEQAFTADEQRAAQAQMQARFDAALTGPLAVARLTGTVAGLYEAAINMLDDAGPEEKASSAWIDAKAAAGAGYKAAVASPQALPEGIRNDPVADFLARVQAGRTAAPRDFSDLAKDARAALDQQIADARAAGTRLVFGSGSSTGRRVDFSGFDSRTLSAIALNQDERFAPEEVLAARTEMRTRSGAALLASFKSGTSATGFSQNLVSAYASMSPEERQAAGWSAGFMETVMQNYQSTSRLASLFGGGAQGSSSGLMSILDYI